MHFLERCQIYLWHRCTAISSETSESAWSSRSRNPMSFRRSWPPTLPPVAWTCTKWRPSSIWTLQDQLKRTFIAQEELAVPGQRMASLGLLSHLKVFFCFVFDLIFFFRFSFSSDFLFLSFENRFAPCWIIYSVTSPHQDANSSTILCHEPGVEEPQKKKIIEEEEEEKSWWNNIERHG